jgi:hypothetical protein
VVPMAILGAGKSFARQHRWKRPHDLDKSVLKTTVCSAKKSCTLRSSNMATGNPL